MRLVLLVVLGWTFGTLPTGAGSALAESDVEAGARAFRVCAACHGVSLEGQPAWHTRQANGRHPAPPHDENGHTWHHRDQHLFRMMKLGVKPPLAPEGYESDMPAFGDVLTDQEIWAVLIFVKSTWSPEVRARQSRRSSGAKQ